MGIGWIFWLGIYTVVAPQFITAEDKRAMFTKQYLAGTFILLFFTIISTILTGYIAAALILSK
jgi:hypothetical protein